MQRASRTVALFGGHREPANRTLARAWCATRRQAAHIELDEIRRLIVSGLADLQTASDLQEEQ